MQLFPVAMSTPKVLPSESLLIGDGACSQIRELLGASVVPATPLELVRQALSGISAALRQRRNEAGPPRILHLLAHGRPGAFRIGDQWIDADALKAHAGDLASWGVETIALWSCHVGADANFVALLQELTGAQVLTASGWLGRDGQGRGRGCSWVSGIWRCSSLSTAGQTISVWKLVISRYLCRICAIRWRKVLVICCCSMCGL